MQESRSTLNVTLWGGDLPVIKLSGEAGFHNRHRIGEAFDRLIEGGRTCIMADLSELQYLDSSSLSLLVKYATSAAESGGFVEIVSASPQVSRALTLCGAAQFFNSRLPEVPAAVGPELPGGSFWHVSQFSLPAVPESASAARGRVADVVSSLPMAASEAQDMLFAVGEALANAIRHGCRCDPNLRLSVKCVAGAGRLTVEVTDPGAGFDPDLVPPPSIELRPEGGMGIFIMDKLVDELSFSFDGGTTVRLVKHIACPDEGVSPDRPVSQPTVIPLSTSADQTAVAV